MTASVLSPKFSALSFSRISYYAKGWSLFRLNGTRGQHKKSNSLFRSYEVIDGPGEVSEMRQVPQWIKKPSYYLTQTPEPIHFSKVEVKNAEGIQGIKNACFLARSVLTAVLNEAKVGSTTESLDEFAHDLIIKNGAYPSPLNYRGYPKSICTSVNNVACHGIPDSRPLKDGDIISIDVTVYLNGYHGDCAETKGIGEIDEDAQKLLKVSRECLEFGIGVCAPGVPYTKIGEEIQKHAKQNGFKIMKAFAGHGIGTYFHGPPDIYHFYDRFSKHCYPGEMEEGTTFTIEPVVSEGSEKVMVREDGWTAVSFDQSRSAQYEHTILITKYGSRILTQPQQLEN